MLIALFIGLGVTIGILKLAGAPRYPPLWLIAAAILAGTLVATAVTPLLGPTSYRSAFRVWLALGPLSVIVIGSVWLKLRWIERRRGRGKEG